jgi:hypothetical protein
MVGTRRQEAAWSLRGGRPVIEVDLNRGIPTSATRTLLADTGAGSVLSSWELVLREGDCTLFGPAPLGAVNLGGAYVGRFLVYSVEVALPAQGLVRWVAAVAVPESHLPLGLDGIAGFRFLNQFTHGNFGQRDRFGLQLP